MPARPINPRVIKLHRTYNSLELAARLGVHKNTVRHWQRSGLEPIDSIRPVLFQGTTVRAFFEQRNRSRKRPFPPGTLYCLRCRQPRAPPLGMVDYLPMRPDSGNLRAICECLMHRGPRGGNRPDHAGLHRPNHTGPVKPNWKGLSFPEV